MNEQNPNAFREDRFAKMIGEVVDYAILMLDIQGNVLTWNAGAEAIKGYTAEDIIGKNFRLFYTPEDLLAKEPDRLLAQATANSRASQEGWRVKKDGSRFWGSIVITALHDDDGHVIGFAKVTRDLTEKRAAEQQQHQHTLELERKNEDLRRSEEKYHRMVAEVEDYAIILLDTQGTIMNWNLGASRIKGYTEQEAVGQNFRIFYPEEGRNAKLPEHLLEMARVNNKASHEGWRQRKDCSLFWGSIVITALHDDQNHLIGFTKLTRDLTHRKEYEDNILLKNKQLEEFAYIASHDLQEPLRKIQLFTGLSLESPINLANATYNMEKVRSSAARMSHLISDVLQYSQLTNPSEMFKPTNLNDVVTNVCVDLELLAKESEASLVIEKLPVINAIPIQMQQLFNNLISNAIKFGGTGVHITIGVLPAMRSKPENWTRLFISDTGPGFDMKHADRLFQMFQKGKSSRSGTGIGLAICKRIVENHNGKIEVQSTLGKGTTFEILLPLNH